MSWRPHASSEPAFCNGIKNAKAKALAFSVARINDPGGLFAIVADIAAKRILNWIETSVVTDPFHDFGEQGASRSNGNIGGLIKSYLAQVRWNILNRWGHGESLVKNYVSKWSRPKGMKTKLGSIDPRRSSTAPPEKTVNESLWELSDIGRCDIEPSEPHQKSRKCRIYRDSAASSRKPRA